MQRRGEPARPGEVDEDFPPDYTNRCEYQYFPQQLLVFMMREWIAF
jgi:hypothetical protein